MENPIVETKTYFNPLKKQFSSEKAAKIGKNEGKYNQNLLSEKKRQGH